MGRKDKPEIDIAKPHTVQKFELIEEYVSGWSQKLLQYDGCDGIMFIDCMCNSGVYQDIAGNTAYGTPIRVAKLLAETMLKYPSKKALLYFNDYSEAKIEILKKHIPPNTANFEIHTSIMDGNDLLRQFHQNSKFPYLLVYDPYEAAIEWDAIMPFLNAWGEVIINHMVSDAVRGLPQAKKQAVKAKYEETYQSDIAELMEIGSDRSTYEQKIKEIISQQFKPGRKHYIASFPFFNRTNALVYDLILCTGNINGFKLFKNTAWKTFGGKSSAKNTHGTECQLMFNIDGESELITPTDEFCYNISDIARYLCGIFKGQNEVSFDEVYGALEEHPIFPSEGFRSIIKQELKSFCHVTVSRSTMSFP